MNTTNIEALIGPFMKEQQARIAEALKSSGPYVIAPIIRAESGDKPFNIYAFIDPACTHVHAAGATVDEALAAFSANLSELRVDKPAKLREQAKKLLAEAAKLEGGAP